jgi:16S rRNA (guanine527-N7)-methyltransferase
MVSSIEQYVNNRLGIQLTRRQQEAFSRYEQALQDWNQRVSLTAVKEPEMIRIKHFLDSLTCMLAMRETAMERIIDVGTGAGFPGIPLKIICPSIHLTLVESVKKKSEFCQYLIEKLKLTHVEILSKRVEEIAQIDRYREQFDWAVARAVASLPVVVEYLLPLVRIGGAALAMKGDNALTEAHQSQNAIRILGGHLKQLIPVELPKVADDRYLIVIDKISSTPREYPRRVGLPAKKPL